MLTVEPIVTDDNYRTFLDDAIRRVTELQGIPPKYLVVPFSHMHWRHPELITCARADWPENSVSVMMEEPE